MKKWISKLLLLIILMSLFAVPVSAATTGSLLLTKVGTPVEVFLVAGKDGIPVEAFAGMAEKLTTSDLTRDMAKKFYQHTQDKKLSGMVGTPNENKEIFFSLLEEGWYLVCSKAEQKASAPFLICVPMDIGGKAVYDIQAEPKIDSPLDPSGPSGPITPEPNIPQTGAVLWPQYLLLGLGAAAICWGLAEVYRGREKRYE